MSTRSNLDVAAIALCLAALAAPARGGCNLPPVPAPGATVTWTAAGGPYEVCSDLVIPATSTVIVEAGAAIDIFDGIEIDILGTFLVQGTPGDPVVITGEDFFIFNHPLDLFGLAQIDFATIGCRLHVRNGGSLLLADSTVTGALASDSGKTYVQVDRCTFSAANFGIAHGTVAVRDTTVSNESVSAGGFFLADNLAIDGGNLSLTRSRAAQPGYINNVSVANFPSGPGLDLSGWNFFLGPDNVLQNNLYPVAVAGGLLPGSTVPMTGNLVDAVSAGNGGFLGAATWSDVGVPWRVEGAGGASGATLTVEPGTVVEFAGGSGITMVSTGTFRAYGRPEAPITFRGLGGATWNGIAFQSNSTGPALKHCIVEDAFMGVAAADTPVANVDSCLFRNNDRGVNASTFGILRAHKCRFEGNDTGARETATGTVDLDDAANPNSFEGNVIAVDGTEDLVDAANCWWGDPSGPTHPANPGGMGDVAAGAVSFIPFLTSPPAADHPPVVRMMKPFGLLETGQKVFIIWDADDDGSIVSQQVLFSEHGNFGFSVLADNLPGTQRSYELTVPVVHPSSNNNPTFIRIVAVDDAGQESFDEHAVFVPYLDDVSGSLIPDTYTGPFTVGEQVDVCWTVESGSGTIDAALLFDGGDLGVGLGGAHTGVNCLPLGMQMPAVSSDTARVRLSLNLGAGGRTAYFYSNEFTIRPDSRMGDDPPVVEMISVSAGGAGCDVTIPIAWSASDDVALRSFDIQASYDGGRTWHFIVRDLPPDQVAYDWHVTPIDGIPDVRVRVIARDLRFQTTSDGGDQSFAIPAGGNPPPGDVNGDCAVNVVDLLALLAAWGPCSDCGACPADLDGDCAVGVMDFLILLANWT